MNLQSNALKFTKEGGKIQIICELVQANSKTKKHKSQSKIQRIMQESFSSNNNKGSRSDEEDSHDSEASRFRREHGIKNMFVPHAKRDKLVISVIDSGIGIKAKDKLRLFKLFGTLPILGSLISFSFQVFFHDLCWFVDLSLSCMTCH